MIFGRRNWDDYRRWNQGSSWVSGIEWAVVNFSKLLRPMSKNSVLEEFSVNRLAVIKADMCCRAFWRWVTEELKSGGQKDRKSCVSSVYRWWFKERVEIRVLTGDVYMMKVEDPGQSLGRHYISRYVRSKSSCHIWLRRCETISTI